MELDEHQEMLLMVLQAQADQLESVAQESRLFDRNRRAAARAAKGTIERFSIAARKCTQQRKEAALASELSQRDRARKIKLCLLSASVVLLGFGSLSLRAKSESISQTAVQAANQDAQTGLEPKDEQGKRFAETSPTSVFPGLSPLPAEMGLLSGLRGKASLDTEIRLPVENSQSDPASAPRNQLTATALSKAESPAPLSTSRAKDERLHSRNDRKAVERKVKLVEAPPVKNVVPNRKTKAESKVALATDSERMKKMIKKRSISSVAAGDYITSSQSGGRREKVLTVLDSGDLLTDLRLIKRSQLNEFEIVE